MTSSQQNGLEQVASPYPVPETVQRIELFLQGQGLIEFCRIDHSGEAEKVGLKMRPTQVIIFGSPKAGTPLMIASPSLAIDLPLKVLVGEDEAGKVWVSYNSPAYLRERHSIPQDLVKNISGVATMLEKVLGSSAG